MSQKMLINAKDPEELRVAIVENGLLEAFYVETQASEQTRGNIYKGVVSNIEPSLGAAFIDYGQPRHGFLQANDLEPALWQSGNNGKQQPPIQKILHRGQQLLVQVVKEPQGNKGSALTTFLSIPGQAIVLTMGRHLSGISRKVEDEAERKRLKEVLGSLKLPSNLGVIARTAAVGRSKRDLQANASLLVRLYEDVLQRGTAAPAPSLINREEELAVRTVRDLFTAEVDEILVDNAEVLERIRTFLALTNPKRQKAAQLYHEQRAIFAKYEIEKQLENIYSSRVSLPSGGSLVIHPTEALVSIDVNSGKSLKNKEIEQTALAVNLEAAAEIARQLRLRDLGGLVVIDFIDMRESKNKTLVQKTLKEALKKDKAKVDIGRLSRFGLLELSRQRIRPPIDFGDIMICPHCHGLGTVRTTEAAARLILRSLSRQLNFNSARVVVNPEVAAFLLNQRRAKLAALETTQNISLAIGADPNLAPDDWRLEPLDKPWHAVPAADPENGHETEKPANSSGGGKARKTRGKVKAPETPPVAEPGKAPEAPAVTAEPAPGKPEPAGAAQATAKPKASNRKPRPAAKAQPASAPKAEEPPAVVDHLSQPVDNPEAAELAGPEAAAPKRRNNRRSGSARRRAKKQKMAMLAQEQEES